MLALLADPTAAAATGWLPFIEKVGIPVALAAAVLWWCLTRLDQRLKEQTAADLERTKALTELVGEVRAVKHEVQELREDVERVREVTGRHHIPPELRAKKEG